MPRIWPDLLSSIVGCSFLVFARMASAIDLSVQSIEVNQAIQMGTTKLFGNNLTWVRVKVQVAGAGQAVSNVDAALRVFVDGQQQPPGPPVFSLNGPITAPLTPNIANINDTVNFLVLPPVSNNVDFIVEVNPGRTVTETSYDNNVLALNNKVFECRDIVELVYVPVNYLANGAGLPPENLMAPGLGDGFLRAIYHPGAWNYHKSPLPPLTWNQNVNVSAPQLLNTLNDIRLNQLPAAGYPQPDLIYGWLPGNPYSGNGAADDIPGAAAFGNTELSRFQRTLAHEIGHCFGLQHNNLTINTVGVDTEHHLKDTQNLGQLHPTTNKDVMVPGMLTSQAYVAQVPYATAHADSRMACLEAAEGPMSGPLLRVSGVVDHANQTVEFDPVMRIALGEPAQHDPNGNIIVIAYNGAGAALAQIGVRTDRARELCSRHEPGQAQLNSTSPLHMLLPETIEGQLVDRIDLVAPADGRVLATRTRSANAPQTSFTSIGAINVDGAENAQDAGAALVGAVRVSWQAHDLDGDALTHTLLYSPNGGVRWLPIAVNLPSNSFEFNTKQVPASRGASGRFRLITTDGLTNVEIESAEMALGDNNAPAAYVLTPNENAFFPQSAAVALHAAAWDMEDLMLSGKQILWTSNLDGTLGVGDLLITSNLSPGTHKIEMVATDLDDAVMIVETSIVITPRVVISPDCNDNGVLDIADISNGTSSDADGNSVPDECETICSSDTNGSGGVDVDDLLGVIAAWGACPDDCLAACPADIDGTCTVDVDDLLSVLAAWGPCP